jgi:hypothetical protein
MFRLFVCVTSAVLLAAIRSGGGEFQGERHISKSFPTEGFVPGTTTNLFPAPNSQFNGLIASEAAPYPEQSGYFRITVYPNGTYSGKMHVGSRDVGLNGVFSPDGRSTSYIYGSYSDCCWVYYYLLWIVDFQMVVGTDEIQGSVEYLGSGGWISGVVGYRSGPWNSKNPSPFQGKYTIRFPGGDDPAVAPSGDGYASVNVDAKGNVKINGALADNFKYNRSGILSTNGYVPLSVSTDSGNGIFIGWLTFGPPPDGEIVGDFNWTQPPNYNATYYPAGFTGPVAAFGSRYLPPSATNSVLSWTNGLFELSGGNLSSPLVNSITLNSSGKLTADSGPIENLTFSLNKNTGVFKGRFRDPQSGISRNYFGVVVQLDELGGGYFLGVNQGGRVRLEAAP